MKEKLTFTALPQGGTTHLYEGVNVVHQSLGSADDELVNTGYGMRPVGYNCVQSTREQVLFAVIFKSRVCSDAYRAHTQDLTT